LVCTLSATMGPLVARVSAAMTTPPSNRHPTMVVPVLVAFGNGTPWAWRATLRLWLEKSKPGMAAVRLVEGVMGVWGVSFGGRVGWVKRAGYAIECTMKKGRSGRCCGVVVLRDGIDGWMGVDEAVTAWCCCAATGAPTGCHTHPWIGVHSAHTRAAMPSKPTSRIQCSSLQESTYQGKAGLLLSLLPCPPS